MKKKRREKKRRENVEKRKRKLYDTLCDTDKHVA